MWWRARGAPLCAHIAVSQVHTHGVWTGDSSDNMGCPKSVGQSAKVDVWTTVKVPRFITCVSMPRFVPVSDCLVHSTYCRTNVNHVCVPARHGSVDQTVVIPNPADDEIRHSRPVKSATRHDEEINSVSTSWLCGFSPRLQPYVLVVWSHTPNINAR